MEHKKSRLENSKDVRRILNRFGVDLTQCQYSVCGKDIRLTGTLLKVGGLEFGASEIESMIQEFQTALRGFTVNGEMDNWSFSTGHLQNLAKSEEAHEEET